ncbi:MAG: A/G-specific adenine glycosylase [Lachnospiraceae bacterium]|nr:A/G-specific adenine glycosylase [Lachnospiraceae bacterium]
MEIQSDVKKIYADTVPYLLQWYDYNRRILPWRESPTPYHVWVSEIMLQQTRVEAVRGYYDRFLTCLPDVAALASAQEEVLLKLWEGLGYYNRVRNMQKAARILVEQYDGQMPAEYEKIRALPGIGDYTAGAIASIAFGLPYPAVDGNVLRVMSRIACSEEDIAKEKTKQKLKHELTLIMPERSGDFNQSLMELGATVCLPNGRPLCDQCPVMHLCKAFHAGRETELPVKSGKKERRVEKRVVYVISCGEKILLHRREKKGLLAGLWEFPNVLTDEKERDLQTRAESDLEQLGIQLPGMKLTVRKSKKAKHIFSHVEWHMEGIRIEAQDFYGNGKDGQEEWAFVTVQELQNIYPVPSAFEVFLKDVKEEKAIDEK